MMYLPWLTPIKYETIQQYAKRMAKDIKDQNPILLGLSFGGMMAIEISKIIQPQQVILISSIQSFIQLPRWMKWAGKLKLNKAFPMRSYKILAPIQNSKMGVETKEDIDMVSHYRKNVSPAYLDWAIHEVLNWQNNWQPVNIHHIHGDADKIFPLKKISQLHAMHIIKGGGHFMVYNRSAEVTKAIQNILSLG